jgi:hypothetical protein
MKKCGMHCIPHFFLEKNRLAESFPGPDVKIGRLAEKSSITADHIEARTTFHASYVPAL